ncbi:MAG: hypothetical protein K6G92_00360 [Bacteroidaceae bacterium]|nr:hypothetical protein [Bacteroidaceae bacterium]
MCCEQPAGYAATGSDYANTLVEPEEDTPQIPVATIKWNKKAWLLILSVSWISGICV